MVITRRASHLTITESSYSNGFVLRIKYNDEENFQSPEPRNATLIDRHEFGMKEGNVSWCPAKAACNGREMRRIMCVVDRDYRRFRILDIDYSQAADNM